MTAKYTRSSGTANKSAKVSIADYLPLPEGILQYSLTYIKQSQSVLLRYESEFVIVGYVNNPSPQTLMMVQNLYRKNVQPVLLDRVEFFNYLSSRYALPIQEFRTHNPSAAASNTTLDTISDDAPIINLVNTIIMEAIQNTVTDIHIECVYDSTVVKHRIDGVLIKVHDYERAYFKSIASRLKIMSNLDIMEQRYPQDGRISVEIQGTRHDIRVSFLPSYDHESIVLRILQEQARHRSLAQLGFSPKNTKLITKCISFQQGLVLVSGPTGSGKTTTLHTILNSLNTGSEKIITIEDPIEYLVKGITQIQVNEKIGLSFDSLLKRVLRHDPNIIMVGEIRDSETATLVAQAALTGHLVFSTIHTNDAVSSIARLKDLGLDTYLIPAVLRGVISQRLVRRICVSCKGSCSPQKPCHVCDSSGLKGRLLLEEFLPIDDTMRSLLLEGASQKSLYSHMKSSKIPNLRQDALQKIRLGLSTKKEIQRQVLLDEAV